jgi:hypothetical protein
MRVVILVPRRADNGRRDDLWAWVKARWQLEQPDWPIHEGVHAGEDPFNRSLAVNRAAKNGGKWDVAIIADSDSFVSKEQIEAAVETCTRTGQMTLAYDRYCYLRHDMSDMIMGGWTGDWWPGVEWAMTGTCSSMVVVTRDVWDEAEGFDEGFVGWASEDVAFSHAAQTFGGGLQRIPGEVWHLWHAPAPRANVEANVARSELYAEASYDKEKMRALIARLREKR